MKQRLGIAVALLHQPRILILDEPTNGLDPKGIIEIRDLLKRLNQEHRITILISSHILAEVEKLVTHIGVINHGKLLFQGTLAELVSKQSSGVLLETDQNEAAMSILKKQGIICDSQKAFLLLPSLKKEEIAALISLLTHAGISIYRVEPIDKNLESIFMDLIK